ncbi:transporter [Bradyrhizobium oligotrophicum]|uniref:transporter n=1 Tax=Bradyrhizobium oligotrophicum TaxID=44255 RepID=UPI001FCBE3CE|nr:transporter [Bradyrhizobium oligotrophicum]
MDGAILSGGTLFCLLSKVEQMRAPHLRMEAPKKAVAGLRGFWSDHADLETVLCIAFMLIVGIIVKLTPPT